MRSVARRGWPEQVAQKLADLGPVTDSLKCMTTPAQFSVLGPLKSGVETRAFLGCEVVDGMPQPQRPVVIVWLPDEVVSDPKRVTRLQRETSFVTQLDHPNIIRVFGLECFEEGWARVVDFVDGEPLIQVIQRAKEEFRPIDPRLAARIIVDVCDAVNYAHEEGQARFAGRPVVHGGIRPDTLMVTFSGRTKVTGYGASVLAPTQHGTPIRDKFVYFAPEQIIGGKATASPATDIYAIGAVLYELLAGKPPFSDDPDPERAVLTGPPPIIDAPGLQGRLGNVASTALAKRGSERFESVETLRGAILAALAAEEQSLPSHEELAEVVGALIPEDGPERTSRRDLLASAHDPDASTLLSPSTQLPEGVDPKLFARSRPVSSVQQRLPRKRDEVTVVDGKPPKSIAAPVRIPIARDIETVVEEPIGTVPGADEVITQGEAAKAPIADDLEISPPAQVQEVTEDVPRVAAAKVEATEPADKPPAVPVPQPVAVPVPQPAASPMASQIPQPGAHPMASQIPAVPMGYTPGQSQIPGQAPQGQPQQGAWAPSQLPPGSQPPGWQPGQGPLQPWTNQVPPGSARPAPQGFKPSAARAQGPQNYLQAASDGQAGLLSNQPVAGLPPPPPPQHSSAIREGSNITQFNKKAGDSSRSYMFLAIAALLGLAVFTFISKEPPKGLDTASERHALPKELLEAALKNPTGNSKEEVLGEDEPGAEVAKVDAGVTDGGPPVATKPGRLKVDSDPVVTVYRGSESLGRTPITVKLPPGRHRLRFTDRKTGLNIYKTFRVRSGGNHRHSLTFGTSQLIVKAPVGAVISLNGRKLGKSPLDEQTIYEGKYLLRVSFEGMSWSERFEAPAGQRIEYKVNLK